jgi:hypothetical protein
MCADACLEYMKNIVAQGNDAISAIPNKRALGAFIGGVLAVKFITRRLGDLCGRRPVKNIEDITFKDVLHCIKKNKRKNMDMIFNEITNELPEASRGPARIDFDEQFKIQYDASLIDLYAKQYPIKKNNPTHTLNSSKITFQIPQDVIELLQVPENKSLLENAEGEPSGQHFSQVSSAENGGARSLSENRQKNLLPQASLPQKKDFRVQKELLTNQNIFKLLSEMYSENIDMYGLIISNILNLDHPIKIFSKEFIGDMSAVITTVNNKYKYKSWKAFWFKLREADFSDILELLSAGAIYYFGATHDIKTALFFASMIVTASQCHVVYQDYKSLVQDHEEIEKNIAAFNQQNPYGVISRIRKSDESNQKQNQKSILQSCVSWWQKRKNL